MPASGIDPAAAERAPAAPNALTRHIFSTPYQTLINTFFLTRHMFLRDVKAARGKGDTVIGRDLLLISLPPDSKEIKQTCLN